MPTARSIGFLLAALITMVAGPCAIAPAQARENLGMYSGWGAFRDAEVPRCYAISLAIPSRLHRDYEPYVAIGTWPAKSIRNQVHFRLSRKIANGSGLVLKIDNERFRLTGGGGDAWAKDKKMDATIISRMRSAKSMTLFAQGANGKGFSNTWPLPGAASAMDAATLACAKLK